jgi:hypothetical protein
MVIELTPAFTTYLAVYTLASVVAVILMIRERKTLVLFRPDYRNFMASKWKLLTFAIAALSMIVMAPYTGDPTWDYFDASFMSILTFLTAPWAVGTLYLALKRRARPVHVYIAVCVWMLSVSWLYDVYIIIKHGYYPPTWLPNIILSSILYFLAGIMWNLQRKEGRGVVFGFMEPDWPNPNRELGFRQVMWFALPIMLLVTAIIGPFLL